LQPEKIPQEVVMFRTLSFVAATAASLLVAAAPVSAQAPNGYYVATPATAPDSANLVTRTTVWKCADGVCAAPKAPQRDAIMCELVVREVGQLTSFTANGTAFDAEALAKCNTRAR
jgi:hypothetical protein